MDTQNRPSFKCNNCGDTWSSGHDGGEYFEYLLKRSAEKTTEYVEQIPDHFYAKNTLRERLGLQ